jgi:hypothetical protein
MPFDSLPLTNETILRLQKMHSLLENGWTQHAEREGTKYCIMGAAKKVSLDVYELARLMGYKSGPANIARWNDSPKRTQREVLNRINKVIKNEREKMLLSL